MFCVQLGSGIDRSFSSSSRRDAQFFESAVDAVKDIKDGATVIVGGNFLWISVFLF